MLPFKYPCIIDSLSGVANNVAIYMNYEESYLPLLIANHFLISYSEELGHGGYNWEYYNDDYGYFIDIRNEAKENGLIKTIKKYIQDNKYIKILIDFYYIKNSLWYKRSTFYIGYPQF